MDLVTVFGWRKSREGAHLVEFRGVESLFEANYVTTRRLYIDVAFLFLFSRSSDFYACQGGKCA